MRLIHMENLKSIVEEIPYIAGNDLYMTIDIDLQKVVEEVTFKLNRAISERKETGTNDYFKVPGGAVVVLSERQARVLAMASYPTYDPSVFTGGISLI